MVQGVTPETKIQDLVEFLQNKAEQPFTVSESYITDGKAFLVIDNRQESIAVQKLSGIRYNQEKLLIRSVKYSGPSAMTEKYKGALVALVEPRFNAQANYLNLSKLQGIEVEGFKIDFNNLSTMRTLWSVIAQKCPTVSTINLASNRIHNLNAFKDLTNHFSGLVNLSLEENNISDFKQLDNLKQIKLRELVLAGNPISAELDEATYRSQVTRRFPALKYLDRVKLQPVISFDIPTYVLQSVLPPSQPSFFDSPQRQTLAVDFLRKFYELYDKNRQGLLEVYTDFSFFSLTTGALERLSEKEKQKNLSEYLQASRNLLKVEDMERRVERLQTGRVNIVHLLSTLPASHHQLEHFTVDSYMLPPVGTLQIMAVNVHGHFWEVETGVNRSFDRSFLLTPAPPGSRALQYGLPVVVMNDMLHVRNYVQTSGDAQAKAPQIGSPGPSLSLPPSSLSLTPTKSTVPLFGSTSSFTSSTSSEDLVQKLSYVTDMNAATARTCLERNGWDYAKALANFYELKGKGLVPPEAFTTKQ